MIVETSVIDQSPQNDRQLLADFVANGDADAFEAIVRRYQVMVMGVCRRIVGQSHDVDDAFQATFLVLARDARKIRRPQALASWLYGVACRVSLRLVREQQRRREEGFEDQAMTTEDSVSLLSDQFDARVLDEEINRLPERYRAPMVLHYFVGKSNSQIAQQLGMTVGTVDGRLKRGRGQLRVRLAKRGVMMSVPGGILAAASSAQASTPALIEQTVTSALEYASGGTPSGLLCSEQALQLAGKELFVMSLTKPMMIATGLFLAAAVGVSAFATQNTAGDDPFGGPSESELNSKVDAPKRQAVRQNTVTVADNLPQEPAAAPNSQTAPSVFFVDSSLPAEEKINAELAKPIDDMDWDKNLLSEVAEFLRDVNGIQVVVDLQALEDLGLSQDDIEITARLSGISLKSALRIMLDPHDLTYVTKNEVMYLTTKEAADEMLETRIYLIDEFVDRNDPNGSVIRLMQTIQTMTDGSWFDVDGQGGTMNDLTSSSSARLAIRQSQQTHEEIVKLLEQLRKANKSQQASGESKPTLKRQPPAGPASPLDSVEVLKIPNVSMVQSMHLVRDSSVLADAINTMTQQNSLPRTLAAQDQPVQWLSGKLNVQQKKDTIRIGLGGMDRTESRALLMAIANSYREFSARYQNEQSDPGAYRSSTPGAF